MREAVSEEMKGRQIGDDRPEAEVDGAYFGGYVKPANLKEDRVDRRLAKNQSGKRKVVVVIRERGGETLPGVFKTEGQALSWVSRHLQPGEPTPGAGLGRRKGPGWLPAGEGELKAERATWWRLSDKTGRSRPSSNRMAAKEHLFGGICTD